MELGLISPFLPPPPLLPPPPHPPSPPPPPHLLLLLLIPFPSPASSSRCRPVPCSFSSCTSFSSSAPFLCAQSLSGFHVIVICFRLLKRIQAPFQAIPVKIRQFQAISGRIGRLRQNQAFFRHFQAKSGSPWIWETIAQGSYGVPKSTNCAQTNHNQTASNGIILPRTWQLC